MALNRAYRVNAERFGAYLDAQQRLLAAGYTLMYQRPSNDARVRPGEYIVSVVGRKPEPKAQTWAVGMLSHATIELADRLAPGAK